MNAYFTDHEKIKTNFLRMEKYTCRFTNHRKNISPFTLHAKQNCPFMHHEKSIGDLKRTPTVLVSAANSSLVGIIIQ